MFDRKRSEPKPEGCELNGAIRNLPVAALILHVQTNLKYALERISFLPDKWTGGTKLVLIRILATSESEPVFLLPISIRVASVRLLSMSGKKDL